MSRDFATEITAAQETVRARVATAEQAAQAFVATTTGYAKQWYTDFVGRVVKDHPEITKAHGSEKLSRMKSDLGALQASADDEGSKVFGTPSPWWHDKADEKVPDMSLAHRGGQMDLRKAPLKVCQAVSRVFGRLGPLLEAYGYRTPGNPPPGDHTNIKDWPEPMQTSLGAYVEAAEAVRIARSRVTGLEREKERAEAEDLWSKA